MTYDRARELRKLKRRVDQARHFPLNTCPASRHLHMMALSLAAGKPYPMFTEEPEHCAETMLWVLESLWKLRTETGHEQRAAELLADTTSPRPALDEIEAGAHK